MTNEDEIIASESQARAQAWSHHDIREDLVAINVDPEVAKKLVPTPAEMLMNGIVEATAKAVAAALLKDPAFIANITDAVASHDNLKNIVGQEVATAMDECEFTSLTSREFEKSVENIIDQYVDVEGKVEEAMKEFTVSADDVDGLDDFIEGFIENRVTVQMEVR